MLLIVIVTAAAILTGLGLILNFINGNTDYWTKRKIVQIQAADIFSLKDLFLLRVPFQVLDAGLYNAFKIKKAKYGGTTQLRHPILYILDLDLIKNILIKDFDHFTNRRGIEFSDEKFDSMLFNMINEDWKNLRATMTPTFTTSKIKAMFGVFNESGKKMIKFLNTEIVRNGDEVELRGVCGRYTMDVIASAAFGVDSQNFKNVNSPFAVNARKLLVFGKIVILKIMFMTLLPSVAKKMKLAFLDPSAINFLEDVVRESIRQRKEGGEKRNDFLQLLLEAQAEQEAGLRQSETQTAKLDGKKLDRIKLTDELLIAQCNLFFVAGFDSIETLLLWACYELAIHPEIQEKLYDELRLATNGNKEELSYDMVNKAEYLDMVVSEILRKYPGGARSERKCNKDYQVRDDDFVIRKGTHVIIPTYAIHHDPEIYPDPQKFDPERFTDSAKASRHPYAYLPFGFGPRTCIANRFAQMEGKAALAHLTLNFKMSPGQKLEIPMTFSPKGVLKPKSGIWLQLETRN